MVPVTMPINLAHRLRSLVSGNLIVILVKNILKQKSWPSLFQEDCEVVKTKCTKKKRKLDAHTNIYVDK